MKRLLVLLAILFVALYFQVTHETFCSREHALKICARKQCKMASQYQKAANCQANCPDQNDCWLNCFHPIYASF